MKSLPALLLFGASVLPIRACDSADLAKSHDFSSVATVASVAPGTPKADLKAATRPPAASAAPAPKPAAKSRDARRTPPPAHLFM
jgi:hypothetical protein